VTRIAVMVSGSGRTLRNLLEAIGRGELGARVVLVIASRECPGAAIARAAGIETLVRPGVIPGEELGRLLAERSVEWVVLAGYLKLVNIPAAYRGRIVNIHPALLPEFGGEGMYGEKVHAAVLAAGRAESGCTVHLVDEAYDRGRILLQMRCPVEASDTPERLGARVFELEKRAYPAALGELFGSG
jgi:phosphoribosylglycinamide formyltransferase-1